MMIRPIYITPAMHDFAKAHNIGPNATRNIIIKMTQIIINVIKGLISK